MGGSPSVPQPTPPAQTAGVQQNYNTQSGLQSQAGSEVNQQNVYGGLNYVQTGTNQYGQPIYTAKTTLSPDQQVLYNMLTETQKTAGGLAQGTLAAGDYGGPNNIVGTTNSLTNQRTADYIKSVQPEFDIQTKNLDNQLRTQGILPYNSDGTANPTYQNAMRELQQTQGQTISGAVAQFQPQAFQEAVTGYQLPLQISQQLAAYGAPQNPTQFFTNTPALNIQPANYTGAVASADQMRQQAYQAQLAQQSSMLNSVFSPLSSLAGGWARNGFSFS